MGMGCKVEDVRDTWIRAFANPIKSHVVENAPCQEIVYTGKDLRNGHGLDDLPVPISSPGWDNAPYTTSSHFVTVDPDTGVQNLGTYRGMIKAPDRMGMNTSIELRSGGYLHWLKYKKMGKPMPCAVVLGCPPVVSYTSVQKVPEIYDELDIAGGLVGAPINVVRCKTVDSFRRSRRLSLKVSFLPSSWSPRRRSVKATVTSISRNTMVFLKSLRSRDERRLS